MKGLRQILLIVAIACAAVTATSTDVTPPDIDIVFVEQVHDFGDVSYDCRQINHKFQFINTGHHDVSIIGSLASCGCTTVKYPRHVIHPFEKGYVEVTYSPSGRPKGDFSRTIRLETTGKRQFVAIKIKGHIF